MTSRRHYHMILPLHMVCNSLYHKAYKAYSQPQSSLIISSRCPLSSLMSPLLIYAMFHPWHSLSFQQDLPWVMIPNPSEFFISMKNLCRHMFSLCSTYFKTSAWAAGGMTKTFQLHSVMPPCSFAKTIWIFWSLCSLNICNFRNALWLLFLKAVCLKVLTYLYDIFENLHIFIFFHNDCFIYHTKHPIYFLIK